ncbi:small ribosomal subunit protein bTHXm [Apium graveolens]|uniref:small ribosomal subunit protein bTHXm n=1 Tax=Apium graveolens TaxID=4045 RepID=UPI003D79FA3B
MAMLQFCNRAAKSFILSADKTVTAATFTSLSSSISPELCGRGDKKTKSGKRFKGSYGNSRPKKEKKIERIKDKVEVPRSTPWPLPFKLI